MNANSCGSDRREFLYVRHGSPFDRGQADSFYQRGFDPHYYTGDTYASERISRISVEYGTEEYRAYKEGFDQNEKDCNFKGW